MKKFLTLLIMLFPALLHTAAFAQERGANDAVKVDTVILRGFQEPNTPRQLNRVGYNRYYREDVSGAPVLVLVSGYLSGAGFFDGMARALVRHGNVEVWTVNRRQTFIENRALLDRDIRDFIAFPKKRHEIVRLMGNMTRYLTHDSSCMKEWGLQVQMEDLKCVIEDAKIQSDRVFLGGWSDGGEYVMAYTHYRFADSKFGSSDLKGIVLLDENSEWAVHAGNPERVASIVARHRKSRENNDTYMTFWPTAAHYTLALELARRHPDSLSPLAYLFGLPDRIARAGITNRGLAGWLFDYSISEFSDSNRGPFSYFIKSGDLHVDLSRRKWWRKLLRKKAAPVRPACWISHKATGEITSIDTFIRAEAAPGHIFELFYPRRVLEDYWAIALCGFNCPERNVLHNRDNRLPAFNVLTRHSKKDTSMPILMRWYMEKNGTSASDVLNYRMPAYAHADIFFAEHADEELFAPLHRWIREVSGAVGTEIAGPARDEKD